MDPERVGLIIEEAGPRDDAIAGIMRSGETSWAVQYGDFEIECEYEPTLDRLMLQAAIGAVPKEKQARAYETMLAYNLIWRETGGVRMALAGPNLDAVQMVDLNGSELSTELLLRVLGNFAEKAEIWREFIAGRREETPIESFSAQNFIRV
jgi:hypothetical protein